MSVHRSIIPAQAALTWHERLVMRRANPGSRLAQSSWGYHERI